MACSGRFRNVVDRFLLILIGFYVCFLLMFGGFQFFFFVGFWSVLAGSCGFYWVCCMFWIVFCWVCCGLFVGSLSFDRCLIGFYLFLCVFVCFL